MTKAICVKCGEGKVGALTRCHDCDFVPEREIDIARSLYLSSSYLDGAGLEDAQEKLKSASRYEYDEVKIEKIRAEAVKSPEAFKMPLGCHLLAWIPIVILLLLIAALVGVVIYIKV